MFYKPLILGRVRVYTSDGCTFKENSFFLTTKLQPCRAELKAVNRDPAENRTLTIMSG